MVFLSVHFLEECKRSSLHSDGDGFNHVVEDYIV